MYRQLLTNPEFDSIIKGYHDPADYFPSVVIDYPDDIVGGLVNAVSPDSLKAYLLALDVFCNRNTGADTTNTTFGKGPARRWCFDKLEAYSVASENRLINSYFQFDQDICGMEQHRNVLSVLPGVGPQKDEMIIIEGHLDSRCETPCI